MLKQFPPDRDFSSLSVRDLIEAREAYHLHLSHLSNVVATAIGRYLIHEDDWNARHPPTTPRPKDVEPITDEKRLDNTVVRPWSWPCVLVFVSKWTDRADFAGSPDQMVPRALFLPDGRVIPTCVVRVQPVDGPGAPADTPSFPRSVIGGGFALTTRVQGRERLGSVGCMVTDGHTTYALTNRHVAGGEGEVVSAVLRGRQTRVGVAAGGMLGKIAFTEAYPGWPGEHAICNMDVGLVQVDDLKDWTTQIAGIGPIGEPFDLTTDNITLDLIGCEAKAFGGASGPLKGRIAALFYRYKSVAGMDYIADLLIGATDGTQTRPGDSGTVWCMADPADHTSLRPLALQWGGHVISQGQDAAKVAQSFALATILSTVCRELDLEVVRDWNSGLPEYWGDVGHYTIGEKACQLLSHNKPLSDLMTANLDRVAYRDELIKPATFKGLSLAKFVPLADVPDKVWKMHGAGARGYDENGNHFADMDRPQPGDNKTLLQLTAGASGKTDPAKVTVKVFSDYYDKIHDPSRGTLPFRVQQLYQLLVKAAAAGDAVEFVAVAGVMAHYVGDSCQPLHISYKFNGAPGKDETGKSIKVGDGVHEAYEAAMLNRNTGELLAKLNADLGLQPGKLGSHGRADFAQNSHEAAVKVVDLMRATFGTINVDDIIDTYVHQPDALWSRFGDDTVKLIADGARCLAMLWESAWIQGQSKIKALGPVAPDQLSAKYLQPTWAPSKRLADISSEIAANI